MSFFTNPSFDQELNRQDAKAAKKYRRWEASFQLRVRCWSRPIQQPWITSRWLRSSWRSPCTPQGGIEKNLGGSFLALTYRLRRRERRIDDALVAGAAAQVARQRFAHLRLVRVGMLAQEFGQ